MKYIYKKKYKNSKWESLFLTALCPLLVIQSVYFKTNNLAVFASKMALIICALCIIILYVFELKYSSLNLSNNKIVNQKTQLIINKGYLILFLIFLINILSYFIPMGKWHSFFNSISIILLLLYKNVYFDNIVIFTNSTMYSGFNKLSYTEIKKISLVKHINNNNKHNLDDVIIFDFETINGFKGYDTMFETDYNMLLNNIKNNPCQELRLGK